MLYVLGATIFRITAGINTDVRSVEWIHIVWRTVHLVFPVLMEPALRDQQDQKSVMTQIRPVDPEKQKC